MENRCFKEFFKIVVVVMFLCVLNYIGTVVFGYFIFGNMIITDILLLYYLDGWVIIVVLLIVIKIYIIYFIFFFCGR